MDPAGLVGQADGEIELQGHTLVLTRISVTFTGLDLDEDGRATAQRVLGFYADGCPVARSVKAAIEITSRLG
ncbi:MAG: hypothetical protein ACTHMZ_11810 [Actinomycetes bacterium]